VKAAPRTPAQRSLKASALQWLAQREHSRAEMRRKLLVHARADGVPTPEASDGATQVEATLDWLEAHNYLSQERFVESRVHARAARFGNLRIRQELAQHAVTLSPPAAQALKESEFDRARGVWARKFGVVPVGLAERARQARFLAGRGFSADVIRRLLRDAASGGELEFSDV
jgi:regulatory protein